MQNVTFNTECRDDRGLRATPMAARSSGRRALLLEQTTAGRAQHRAGHRVALDPVGGARFLSSINDDRGLRATPMAARSSGRRALLELHQRRPRVAHNTDGRSIQWTALLKLHAKHQFQYRVPRHNINDDRGSRTTPTAAPSSGRRLLRFMHHVALNTYGRLR